MHSHIQRKWNQLTSATIWVPEQELNLPDHLTHLQGTLVPRYRKVIKSYQILLPSVLPLICLSWQPEKRAQISPN